MVFDKQLMEQRSGQQKNNKILFLLFFMLTIEIIVAILPSLYILLPIGPRSSELQADKAVTAILLVP
ncbi:MAG: hypothetical protein KAT56_06030 [Sedimentisphaerales bacterium]|nr:hypothetical protein [Sedimentisphaerales bacterium]